MQNHYMPYKLDWREYFLSIICLCISVSHYNWSYNVALRKVIHECTGNPLFPLPSDIEKASCDIVKLLQKVAPLFDIIGISHPQKVTVSYHPPYMELTGQASTKLYVFSTFIAKFFKLVLLYICDVAYFVRCLDFYCIR